MRICRRGLHEIPDGKRECPVCKKTRDDVHRANHWLSGRKAPSERDWYRNRYATDPDFREAEKERSRRYWHERRAPARKLGITVAAHRDITS